MHPALIVCMGVSGSGKSTYAGLLSETLRLPMLEADDFHSERSKLKMQSGTPLTDADREPWMQEICARITATKEKTGWVIAHSALRRKHREQLRGCGLKTFFLHFYAPKDIIEQRMNLRANHFMPAGLLDSQFATLEPTSDEPDVIEIDASRDINSLKDSVYTHGLQIQKQMNYQ